MHRSLHIITSFGRRSYVSHQGFKSNLSLNFNRDVGSFFNGTRHRLFCTSETETVTKQTARSPFAFQVVDLLSVRLFVL